MASATSTVVPANRLGQLLAEARLREGADLEEFAARSDFTVGELSDFEAGHRVLNDRLIAQVTELYEIDCGPIVPQRAELTIDLTDNMVSAAGHALPLESAVHDHVLERYLSLVYVLRNHEPGTKVPLRDKDVAILAASLAEREELIEEQLLLAMAEQRQSVTGLVGWLRKRLWVPGAGAVVGAVSIGTLVMITSDSGTTTTATNSPEPDPEPGNAPRPNQTAGLILPAGVTASTAAGAAAIPSTSQAATTTSQAATTTSEAATSTSTAASATPTTGVASRVAPATTAATTTAAPATTATPTTAATTTTATQRTPQTVGAQAEALLPFNWQAALPGWTITYSGPNSGFRGLTYPYDNTIEMFVRDGDTPQSLAGILAHEIGHAIDVTHFGDSERNAWRDARGIKGAQWWPDAYASDFQSGAGDFAESFAYWAVGDPSSSQIAGTPNGAQLDVLRQLVAGIV